MTAEEIKALEIERKLQIMEAIWEDLRDRFEKLGVSNGTRSRGLSAGHDRGADLRMDPEWIWEELKP